MYDRCRAAQYRHGCCRDQHEAERALFARIRQLRHGFFENAGCVGVAAQLDGIVFIVLK